MTPFDEAVALTLQADGSFIGRTHPAYANMVGPFGGVTAAQALACVLRHPERLGEPVALTVNFCAALAEGEFSAVARPLRTNRSTQHWTVEFSQHGQTMLTATVFTALRRDTWADDEHRMPAVAPPAEVPKVVRESRVAWLDRYEMRFADGGFPLRWDGAETPSSRTRQWVRDVPPRPLDLLSLTALADTFYPRIWRRRATPVPIGTVSMTVYYFADAARLARTGGGWLLGQSQAQAFRGGYFDETGQLWNEAGELLATTHQVVYFKE
jgi:acyl-CoA thioesterase